MDAARLGAFELKAYADQDLTLDQLNAYYHELCVRSGETSDFAQTTYGWELVPHLLEALLLCQLWNVCGQRAGAAAAVLEGF